MTTVKLKDYDGNALYMSGTGAGTSGTFYFDEFVVNDTGNAIGA